MNAVKLILTIVLIFYFGGLSLVAQVSPTPAAERFKVIEQRKR